MLSSEIRSLRWFDLPRLQVTEFCESSEDKCGAIALGSFGEAFHIFVQLQVANCREPIRSCSDF